MMKPNIFNARCFYLHLFILFKYDLKGGDFISILSPEQLLEASKICIKGVSWKSSTQLYYNKRLMWISNNLRDIDFSQYAPKKQHVFKIHERGKQRIIRASHISDRVVQKAFNQNILKPALYPHLIYDNAASQPGKGTEFCLNRVKCHLNRYYHKHGNEGYALLIDFSNYFATIDKDILLSKIRPHLNNEEFKFLKILLSNEKEGLGLGSEINQTCAIFYVSDLDHYIKEKLRIKGYCRYMDDLILIHEDKDYLKYCLEEIKSFCAKLNVTVNPKKCKIVNLKSDWITYLKKRIKLTDTGKIIMKPLNKNLKRRKARLKRQKQLLDKGKIEIEYIQNSYISWRGYVAKYDVDRDRLVKVDLLFGSLFGLKSILYVLSKFENNKYYLTKIKKARLGNNG